VIDLHLHSTFSDGALIPAEVVSRALAAGYEALAITDHAITARKGHSLTNGHVAHTAVKTGARMVYNTDAHAPGDFTPWETSLRIVRGASLSEKDAERMQGNARELLSR